MKNFVKALDKESQALVFLKQKFLGISEAKRKTGIFDGSQIKEFLKNSNFDESIQDCEKKAWCSFKSVVTTITTTTTKNNNPHHHNNHRSQEYKSVINKLLMNYQALGAHMFIKMHFLSLYFDYFSENCGDFSKEQVGCFHQDI